jgi:glycerophosphoryl diester phosphodiesterase
MECSADMIAVDCQMTKDGHIVVIHDAMLKRTTNGQGLVKDKTLAQLKKLDAGSWFHRDFSRERIPTLEETLQMTDGRVGLILEIKNHPYIHLGIEIRILFALNRAGALARTLVASSDYASLRKLREFSPDVRIGVLVTAEEREDPIRFAQEIHGFCLLVRKDLMTPMLLRETQKRRLRTMVWTVNDHEEIQHFAGMGVEGILSDFPERLSRFLRSQQR